MRRNKFLKHGNNISSLHETMYSVPIHFGTVLQVNTFLSHWVRLIRYSYGCAFLFVTALTRYNSHTIQFMHLKCTIRCLLVYSGLCSHHHRSILEHFIALKKKLCNLSQSPCFLLSTPSPVQPLTYCQSP